MTAMDYKRSYPIKAILHRSFIFTSRNPENGAFNLVINDIFNDKNPQNNCWFNKCSFPI